MFILITFVVTGIAFIPGLSNAAPPVVKTVPWVATNPLIPHDTWSGKQITLKGTADIEGPDIQYTWDFGDGTPVAMGTVTNKYAIETTHTYNGEIGIIFTARLTVRNTTSGETGTKEYYVQMRDKTLPVEVNVAIDEGLWYLHKTQRRTTENGVDFGDWLSGGSAASGWYGVTAANLNAFEVNGHLESGDPNNPYVETVSRAMRRLFTWLTTDGALSSSQVNPLGAFNPDGNGNGYGVYVNQSNPFYQGGMFMDAIIASGTPNSITTTGEPPLGGNPGILGRTYACIVQDMVDAYAYCQYDGFGGGGWRYVCNEFPDNSSCQWAAIGLIAAQRVWGLTLPKIVKDWNVEWLKYSQDTNTGWFGYTSTIPIWGPYATTPSGMVQMAMDGIGRGGVGFPSWDKAETFISDNFCNTGNGDNNIREYYYGLFSFVKAMLLHDSNGDGIAEPIKLLVSQANSANSIDWYGAAASNGDRCDGVARTIINHQTIDGYWYGHNLTYDQYPFETAFAIMMLNRTVFEAGAPVAVARAIPNPAEVGQTITLNGSGSYHQDSSKMIVTWEWDVNNDGTFEKTGAITSTSFSALGDYPVRLRVTDNAVPGKSAETFLTVRITIPPIAPTAYAGGPYIFCLNQTPWCLDGSGSVNPDEGKHEIGNYPGDTIAGRFYWDLDGDGLFDDATGVKPNVTGFWGIGSYLIQLKVVDTSSTSFPSWGVDLSSMDSAQVVVKDGDDPDCLIPEIAVSPTSHDFGNTTVNTLSTPQTFTITNDGTGNLIVGTIVMTGTNASEFRKQIDNCSNRSIPPSTSCTVEVIFSPSSEGSKNAILAIQSNDANENPTNILLFGTGITQIQHVILIVVDGLRKDKLYGNECLDSKDDGVCPNLKNIFVKEPNVRLDNVFTTFPTVTFSANASLVTGCYPNKHGIPGNTWMDRILLQNTGSDSEADNYFTDINFFEWQFTPDVIRVYTEGLATKDLRKRTIYDFASAKGLTSTIVYHMYSTCGQNGIGSKCNPVDHSDINVFWVAPGLSEGPNYKFDPGQYDRNMIFDAAYAILDGGLPNLLTLYFAGHDANSHKNGVKDQIRYLRDVIDPLLGILLNGGTLYEYGLLGGVKEYMNFPGLKNLPGVGLERTVFVITSDHGQHDVFKTKSAQMEQTVEEATRQAAIQRMPKVEHPVSTPPIDLSLLQNEYFVALNGGMAEIYVRDFLGKNWAYYPALKDIYEIVGGEPLRYYTQGLIARRENLGIQAILIRDSQSANNWTTNYQLVYGSIPIEYHDVENRLFNLASDRSGDIIVLPKATYEYDESRHVANHGSLNDEDSLIPLIFSGQPLSGRPQKVSDKKPSIVDIAPTIGKLLGFEMTDIDGQPIAEVAQ